MSVPPARTEPPSAVTFDFWDTLVCAGSAADTRRARRDRLVAVLTGMGIAADETQLDHALARVRRTFDEHWAANRQFTGHDATEVVLADLGVTLDATDRARVADAFMGVGDPGVPPLTDNIAPVLRSLKQRDVRLGIICDVGLSPSYVLRGHLEHHGVLGLFDHWSFSDEVGVYKPDGRIFEHALSGLGGVEPSAAAHVGDLRRTDVAGARAFGMTAIRYAGSNDDRLPSGPPAGEGDAAMAVPAGDAVEADVVITDHAALLGALGFE